MIRWEGLSSSNFFCSSKIESRWLYMNQRWGSEVETIKTESGWVWAGKCQVGVLHQVPGVLEILLASGCNPKVPDFRWKPPNFNELWIFQVEISTKDGAGLRQFLAEHVAEAELQLLHSFSCFVQSWFKMSVHENKFGLANVGFNHHQVSTHGASWKRYYKRLIIQDHITISQKYGSKVVTVFLKLWNYLFKQVL